ncbi:MAG: hypothetical protein WBA97_08910, partial [Actinophytocola sp.]|uniref:hypothetical protein n=1 Tax=Actinophytocola sp. TaxID=1872138 RepID=UPI003C711A82
MTGSPRIGVGRLGARDPLCLFVPSDAPTVVAARAEEGDHLTRAVRWALTVLGHGHRGGTLLFLADGAPTALDECLAAAMAVDDAVAGGHRPGA